MIMGSVMDFSPQTLTNLSSMTAAENFPALIIVAFPILSSKGSRAYFFFNSWEICPQLLSPEP